MTKRFTWEIPHINGEIKLIPISDSDSIIIIGTNGSGKSHFLQNFIDQSRIIIHQNEHNGDKDRLKVINILANRVNSIRSNIKKSDGNDVDATFRNLTNIVSDYQTRYRLNDSLFYSNHMSIEDALITRLIDENNRRARKIAKSFRSNNFISENIKDVCDEINNLLKSGFFDFSISIDTDREKVLATKNNSLFFNVNSLSDGERNAFLIAIDIILADSGSIIVIDEPERHMYRANVIPFLLSMINIRNDCSFIISTHEIGLPVSMLKSTIIKVKQCIWPSEQQENQLNKPESWDYEIVESDELVNTFVELDEEMRGPKRKILFVEGRDASLDNPLYQELFDASIIPAKGKPNLRKNLISVRQRCADFNYADFYGLIDKDDPSENFETTNGIFVLNVHSVESLYCCRKSVDAIINSTEFITNKKSTDEVINEMSIHIGIDSSSWDEYCDNNKMKSYIEKLAKTIGLNYQQFKKAFLHEVKKNNDLRQYLQNKTGLPCEFYRE